MSIKKLNKLGELFCGAGGLAEGAKKAGFKHVWATDIDSDACKSFEKHHKNCRVIPGDVYKEFIKGRVLKENMGPCTRQHAKLWSISSQNILWRKTFPQLHS